MRTNPDLNQLHPGLVLVAQIVVSALLAWVFVALAFAQ